MNGQSRRDEIIKILRSSDKPVSASKLAENFGVSRQVIVQDIALLRATGVQIDAMARGYCISAPLLINRVFKTYHNPDDVSRELQIIVDAGGIVSDVFIYHRSYGTVRATMDIKTRVDVEKYVESLKSGKSSLLSGATSGYHYHTVYARDTQTLDYIEKSLKDGGFLAPVLEHEPPELTK